MTAQSQSQTAGARLQAGIAFVLGLAAILGALGFQYIGGLYPCVLCLTQRWPYYIGLPLVLIALLGWRRFPAQVTLALLAGAAALFAWGALIGGYHAGVEWGFFEGPQSCVGVGDAISFDALSNLETARVVPCDAIQFELFGISLAGFNALISAAVAVLLALAALAKFREARA